SDRNLRSALVQVIYRRSYEKTEPHFRPYAREVLEQLLDKKLPAFVVTNSDTEAVTQKINSLKPGLSERLTIRGNAKKFILTEPKETDETFSALPESKLLPTLPERPIFLRRGFYYEVLREIWQKTGTSPQTTL